MFLTSINIVLCIYLYFVVYYHSLSHVVFLPRICIYTYLYILPVYKYISVCLCIYICIYMHACLSFPPSFSPSIVNNSSDFDSLRARAPSTIGRLCNVRQFPMILKGLSSLWVRAPISRRRTRTGIPPSFWRHEAETRRR